MYASIIVALDGSEQSMLALEHARAIAECFGSKLILVHAFPHTFDLRDSIEYNNLVALRIKRGEEIIEMAREQLGRTASIEVDEDLLEGPAAEAILSAAATRNSDLIVMGSRGMGSLKGMVFGSVSTKVSHYAGCPVMVVR
jgi:nucleotide-binding universal stress UspA family protein